MSNNNSVKEKTMFEVSVLCIPGVHNKIQDNFFVDGRSREWLDSSIVNLICKRGTNDGVYAITSDMDAISQSDGSYVSLVRELDAFQNKYSKAGGYIDSKTRILGELLDDVENYIHTLSVGGNKRPSVACMYVQDGCFTASTLGDALIYRYRDDLLVPLCNISDNEEKLNRLIDLGIVAENEACKYESADSSKKLFQLPQDKFKTGDSFVLCSGAASKYLNEDRIALLCSSENVGTALSDMMRGALIEEYEDDLTVMVIKVKANSEKDVMLEDDVVFGRKRVATYDDSEGDYGNKVVGMSPLTAGIVACVLCLVLGLVFGYKVLPAMMGRAEQKPVVAPTQSAQKEDKNKGKDVLLNDDKKTDKDNSDNVVEKTPAPVRTEKPTAKPTVKPTAKPTAKPTEAPQSSTNSSGDVVVTARNSDTFWGLANKYCKDTSNSTMNKIAKASGKKSINDYIHAGDKITIPKSLLK